MSGVMEIFEEYRPQNKDAKVSLAGVMRYWSWFKILVLINQKINLIKELKSLNNLLAKHVGHKYEENSVCLNEPYYYPPEQSLGFMSREKYLKQCLLILC